MSELYQISDEFGSNVIAVDWNKLPDDVISNITRDSMYTVFSYSKDESLNLKTVVYFRKVKKFRKGIKEFPCDDIIFGV